MLNKLIVIAGVLLGTVVMYVYITGLGLAKFSYTLFYQAGYLFALGLWISCLLGVIVLARKVYRKLAK